MIDNQTDTENIKLAPEQLKQLDEFNRRLASLQTEISIAVKNLIATKKDAERATKEKAYQEELLSDLEGKTDIATKRLINLQEQIGESEITLEVNTEHARTMARSHIDKGEELSEQEKKLLEGESELKKQVEDFNIKSGQLLKDQLSITTAKDAFLKATETVVWK